MSRTLDRCGEIEPVPALGVSIPAGEEMAICDRSRWLGNGRTIVHKLGLGIDSIGVVEENSVDPGYISTCMEDGNLCGAVFF